MYTLEELRKECNLLEYCFINAISKRKKLLDKILDNIKRDKDGFRKFDIKLVVNGVDVPLMNTFKSAEKQMDLMIFEKATELLKERMNDFDSKLSDAYEDFETKMTKIIFENWNEK